MNNRNEWMEKLEAHPREFAGVIRGLTEAQLSKRPDDKNWAVTEVICHLRDTEELFFTRFQNILAMSEPKFSATDADRWAVDRQYLRNDIHEALGAFQKRREETLQFLRGLQPDQWNRVGIHSKYGPLSIDKYVELMVNHGNDHLAQLKRALAGKP